MSILIGDMVLPENPDDMIELAIFGDGKVLLTGKGQKNPDDGKFYYTSTNPEKLFRAISVCAPGLDK